MTPSYRILYGLAVLVTVVLAGLAAVMAAGPDSALGLSERAIAWAGVIAAMLGTLNGFLPRITKPPAESREGLD